MNLPSSGGQVFQMPDSLSDGLVMSTLSDQATFKFIALLNMSL